MNQVCLDANVWIKVLTEEADSLQAQELVRRCFKEHTKIFAPSMMKMEVGSILRKKWSRGLLSREQLQDLWRNFTSLPITFVEYSEMYDEAWRVAEKNHLVHLYDAIYLAISRDMEFWTADERLVHSIKDSNVRIKLLSSFSV